MQPELIAVPDYVLVSETFWDWERRLAAYIPAPRFATVPFESAAFADLFIRKDSPAESMDEVSTWCVLLEDVPGNAKALIYREGGEPVVRVLDGNPDIRYLDSIRRALRPVFRPEPANDNHPVDLWREATTPALPGGLLPPVIEAFALERGAQMGVDPGALAMATLTVCAGAIPDEIKLQVKQHDKDWQESARLWCALIGNPSAKKTPVISAAIKPLAEIEHDLVADYRLQLADWHALPKERRALVAPPKQLRAVLHDTTIEATQDLLQDNHRGLLLCRDELSGWFGSMEKYNSGRGGAADRAFWLQSFNGGASSSNRISRGLVYVPNASITLLGGIQPSAVRAIATDMVDDGLLQRMLPIVMGSASVDIDEPTSLSSGRYGLTVLRLYSLKQPFVGLQPAALRFDKGAQDIRSRLAEDHHAMQADWEPVNKKLASHIGKYDGMFARLCVVFHCIESDGDKLEHIVSADVADRVARFLHLYLFRHAVAFYAGVLGLADKNDMLLAVAGHILAQQRTTISVSEARRGDRVMRRMTEADAADVLSQLEALGWLDALPQSSRHRSAHYKVSPSVHAMFEAKAHEEAERRAAIRQTIQASI